MSSFVREGSIVREIWGESDIIMFIFAGSAAEFALNKSVDWLYFTGKLPADPIGRMFSTVGFSRRIVFSEEDVAMKTIESIVKIHERVEKDRSAKIPNWAHQDVLSMLIDYSIRAFELLRRELTIDERDEVFKVFLKVGKGLKIDDLPQSFEEWKHLRQQQLTRDFEFSQFTADLFKQYKRQLGSFRFLILKEAQKLMLPDPLLQLLQWKRTSVLRPVVPLYKLSRNIHLDSFIKMALLPAQYQKQVKAMDVVPL